MLEFSSLILIAIVALGTYSLRVSGLLLSNRLVKEGRIKIFLDYLPATLLLALILPSIIKEGVSGLIASAFIILCMYKTNNILLSMCIGIAIVGLNRNFGFL